MIPTPTHPSLPLRVRYYQARLLILAWITKHRRRPPTDDELAARARSYRAAGSATLEVAGMAIATAGLFVLAPWLGLLAGGGALMLVGRILEPPAQRGEQ